MRWFVIVRGVCAGSRIVRVAVVMRVRMIMAVVVNAGAVIVVVTMVMRVIVPMIVIVRRIGMFIG
jgi:hypothetical protein